MPVKINKAFTKTTNLLFPGESLPSQFLEPSDLSLQTNDLTANPPTTSAPLYVSPPEPQVGYFTARPATQEDMKTSMYTTQAAAIPGVCCNISGFSRVFKFNHTAETIFFISHTI